MSKRVQGRSFVLGVAGGAVVCVAAGAMIGLGQAGGPESEVRLTWSNDGRTVYIWSLAGKRLDYVDTARAPTPRGAEERPAGQGAPGGR